MAQIINLSIEIYANTSWYVITFKNTLNSETRNE